MPEHRLDGRAPLLSVAVCIILALACAGITANILASTPEPTVSPSPSRAPTHTLRGSLTLLPGQFTWPKHDALDCTGISPYQNLKPGAAITVASSRGHTLATGTLSKGVITLDSRDLHNPTARDCVFNWHIPGIPTGLSNYHLRIGTNTITLTELDLSRYQLATAEFLPRCTYSDDDLRYRACLRTDKITKQQDIWINDRWHK